MPKLFINDEENDIEKNSYIEESKNNVGAIMEKTLVKDYRQ